MSTGGLDGGTVIDREGVGDYPFKGCGFAFCSACGRIVGADPGELRQLLSAFPDFCPAGLGLDRLCQRAVIRNAKSSNG